MPSSELRNRILVQRYLGRKVVDGVDFESWMTVNGMIGVQICEANRNGNGILL